MSEDKALCITYAHNNNKLKKIVTMQKDRKLMLDVVRELKGKIRIW